MLGLPVLNGDEYVISIVGGYEGSVCDWQLQKLDPPAEPVEMTRVEEVAV